MRYSQSIKIGKETYDKQYILDHYNNFLQIIKDTNTDRILVSLTLTLSSSETYNFDDIETFKNQITSHDEIKSVALSVIGGTSPEKSSVSLISDVLDSIIMISSINKAWVDDLILKNKKRIEESKEQVAISKEYENSPKHKPWSRNEIIGVIGAVATIIFGLLAYISSKN